MNSDAMSADCSEFEYLDRGAGRTLVLLPGWAADEKVFEPLRLEYDYLIRKNFSPAGFRDSLCRELAARGIKRISLFGWSLGGFLAADFCREHPLLVEELFLVSVRRRYPPSEVQALKRELALDRSGCLRRFYRRWFSPTDDGRLRFRERLLAKYLEEMPEPDLLAGLDYFSRTSFPPGGFRGIRVVFVHGGEDRIAPKEEAKDLATETAGAEFVLLPGAGHAPFLNSGFTGVLDGR